jgi:transposase
LPTLVNSFVPEKEGFKPQAPTCEIINCILYKLKTGIQWHLLPVESLFSNHVLHYKTVFGHYRRWSKEGIWKKCWIELLKKYKSSFDLSMVNLDGSHSSCIRGGEEVAYQGRKKRKTTNTLYLTDKQGLVLAMSTPVSGNHNDLFNIEQTFEELTTMLEDATISVDGLFLNADAGRFAVAIRFGKLTSIMSSKTYYRQYCSQQKEHY